MTTSIAMCFAVFANFCTAADAVTAGDLATERPTFHALGFDWSIAGDADGDATAQVRFRVAGQSAWRTGLPLMRIGRGRNIDLSMIGRGAKYALPDSLAGSIVGLTAGTTYEVELTLVDPDGVSGTAIRTLTLTTRAEPGAPSPTETRHVYPPGFAGKKEQPAFENLMHAVNGYPPICDTYQTIHPAAAKPGTLILVHGGLHTYDNQLYWKDGKPQFSYWLHGMITLVANGTAEHPIRIQAAGDGEPILDGAGAGILLNLRSADHLHIEGLTFRNCGIAIWGGFQGERGGGCLGLTVRQCWFENLVTGIMAQDGRSVDFTITDNVFLGRNPLTQVNGFGRTVGGYAVNLGGQGHTVAWNHAAGFWDGINVFTSALADPQYGQQARAIDIEHNDLSTCSDQFIETDGGFANIRVIGNRMVNCSSQPISCQPVHAGPVYWIRNILWNVHGGKGAMKEHSGAQAYVFLHNTSSTHMMVPFHMSPSPDLCTWWIRNNLCLGPTTVPTQAQYLDADAGPRMVISHNAYRASVPKGVWKVGKRSFDALAALTQATGLENGSILVDGPAIFARASDPVHHAKIGSPVITAESIDLTPTHGVVDAGIAIPGVNDGYVGKAPDIGAIESGQPAPSWGPRHSAHPERLAALRAGTYQPAAEPAP